MKKLLFSAIAIFFALATFAQTSESTTNQTNENTINQTNENAVVQQDITSIRPDDGTPAKFPTQAVLDEKIADKIAKIKEQIRANADNSEKVEYLRKELWRFENAVVAKK